MITELILQILGVAYVVHEIPDVDYAFIGGLIGAGANWLGGKLFGKDDEDGWLGSNPAATIGAGIGGYSDHKFRNRQLEQDNRWRRDQLAEDRRQFDAEFGLEKARDDRYVADRAASNPQRKAALGQVMNNMGNRAASADATQVGLPTLESGDFGIPNRKKKRRNADPRTDARY